MNQYTNKKLFCKVCQDAGKNVLEYSNHNLKNEKETIVCPTLLEQSCRYCNKKGHTVKYCSTLTKLNKEEKKITNRNIYLENANANTNANANKNKNTKSKKNRSLFQALCDDSSDEEKVIEKKRIIKTKQDEFPELISLKPELIKTKDKQINANINTLSFKNIIRITKEKEEEEKRQIEETYLFSCINEKKYKKDEVKIMTAPEKIFVPIKKRNWADVYSSDEEEEEDNFCSNYCNPYDSD